MPNGNALAYRFGDFVLNVERGCLQRRGNDLELRPKAFELLLYLVQRAGKLASKDELVQAAWPNVAVSDDSLAQCVSDVRRLLDDEGQRFIKTVPRRGYVFVADVEALDADDVGGPAVADEPKPADVRRSWLQPRWDFASFGAGLMVAVLLVVAWMGARAALSASTEPPAPPFPLFQGNRTVLGQTIAYPAGTPLLRAAVLVSQPGETFDWHLHRIPAFGYVLEGEITVDYGSKGTRTFRTGDAMLEAMEWPHQVSNRSAAPARIFAMYLGAEGSDFSTPVSEPR